MTSRYDDPGYPGDEYFYGGNVMSDASCPSKVILVEIQENGIIRREDTGYLIGRLTEDYKYEDLPDEEKS